MAEITLFRGEPNQQTLAAGEILFEAGDSAESMYAVIEGAIEVLVDERVVETVLPGSLLGEVALLGPRTRTATARAASPTTVAVVDEHRFMQLVKTNPFLAIEVMRLLATRLERATTTAT